MMSSRPSGSWGPLLLVLSLLLASPAAAADAEPAAPPPGAPFHDEPDVTRFIVGFEQAAASAAESEQRYFVDFTIDVGFRRGKSWARGVYGPLYRTWGTVRLTSVPQQIDVPVGQFAAQFDQNVAKLKVNEVAQAGELLAGGERILATWPNDRSTTSLDGGGVSMSAIVGAGVITPLDPKSSLRVFELTDDARQRLGIDPSKNYVAFVSKDRDKFFRQWYAGVRFRTHYKSAGAPRLDSVLDLAIGQNEAITGGHLSRAVVRIEGFYPLPVGNGFIYLYGTVLARPKPVSETEPLLMRPAASSVVVPAPDVEVRSIPQVDKDFYRFGIGVDVLRLVKQLQQ